MKSRNAVIRLTLPCLLLVAVLALGKSDGKPVTVKGYVLDSACAFTCAKAGSPLVILSDDGTIYWPIAETTPSSGQNDKLLPYAGQKVTASGKVFQRGGSSAMVIDKLEPLSNGK